MTALYNMKSRNLTLGTDVAEKLQEWIGQGAHASGDVRVLYMTLDLRSSGSGEALRPRTRVYGTGINSAHGQHCTLHIAAGGGVSGLGVGLRVTLEAAAESRTLTGTLCALQVDSNIGANNTVPSICSFIRITDVGSVTIPNLFEVPNAANGTIFAAHGTDSFSHSLKIISANGTAYYIMVTDTATNRS